MQNQKAVHSVGRLSDNINRIPNLFMTFAFLLETRWAFS
jgi:hypothetical protein